MKVRALLAATALLLWAAAWLLPATFDSAHTWWLLDASASMVGAPAPPESDLDPARTRWFARGLARSAEAEAGREESALGAALLAMRAELRPGDLLRVYSDGRATDALPPRALFADCQIQAVTPPPGPRLVELSAPSFWPAEGQLTLAARLLDAHFERAEISVEASPGAVEILRAVPVSDGQLRLELRALDPLHPPALLRLRWREGARSTARAVAIAAPETAPLLVLDPAHWSTHEEEVVRAGGTLLLASAELSAWLPLPPEFRPFQADPDFPPLAILLDRSGSMDQGGLDAARDQLEAWSQEFTGGAGLRVQAFAERLEAPLDLRRPQDRAQLAALLPFGPTRLTEALREANANLPAATPILLISDGLAEAPPEGWAQWRATALANRTIFCVPAGNHFDAAVLAALGEAITTGSFAARLQQAFDRLQAPVRADGFAVSGASLPLPTHLPLPHPRAAFAPAAGAELLMQDAAGRAVLCGRRCGSGTILGLAAPAEFGWPAELVSTGSACRQNPSAWWEGRLILWAGPPPPQALQSGQALDLLLLDPGPPARWEALRADPRLPVLVGGAASGGSWVQPPSAESEWVASDAAWKSWCASGEGLRNQDGPRPTLLMAALVAASLVFILTDRARA